MQGYTVRFNVNGVYNNSDPFRTREAAQAYADHLDKYGGIEAEGIASTTVSREGHFTDAGRFG